MSRNEKGHIHRLCYIKIKITITINELHETFHNGWA